MSKDIATLDERVEAGLAIVERAIQGDPSVLPAIRDTLRYKGAVMLFGGELGKEVEKEVLARITGKNLASREAILRKMKRMRRKLAGGKPTPVEALLVERAVACWLQLHETELAFFRGEHELSPAQGDYHQRRIDRANRRYLLALRALAQVRKLAVPALQVNLAGHQLVVGK